MDREKVIHAVETAFELWIDEYTGCSWFKEDEVRQAKKNAISLLKQEETTFKPHYIDKYGKHFICGVECGACHKEISSTYHYCPYCGRTVKFE